MLDINGKWQGRNLLWIEPGTPVHESDSTAEVRTVAKGQFTEISYTWAYEGEPQEGRLLLGRPNETGAVEAVLFDTWHLNGTFMTFKGTADPDGAVSVMGFYAAPSGPDWGWEITVDQPEDDAFNLRMFNIPPGSEKIPAVEVKYSRRSKI
jgi:hypothetical protein